MMHDAHRCGELHNSLQSEPDGIELSLSPTSTSRVSGTSSARSACRSQLSICRRSRNHVLEANVHHWEGYVPSQVRGHEMTADIKAIARRLVVVGKRDGRSIYDEQGKRDHVQLWQQRDVLLTKITRAFGVNISVLCNWLCLNERAQAEAWQPVGRLPSPAAVQALVAKLRRRRRLFSPTHHSDLSSNHGFTEDR
jgi:transposase-like protein